MRAGGEKICSAGMVLIPQGGKVHPDEPDYCIGIMEVSQAEDQRFWTERQRSGFELVVKKKDGSVKVEGDSPSEAVLKQIGSRALLRSDVKGVEVAPVVTTDKPQPEGNLAGFNKPALYRTLNESRDYCRTQYPGGDLPTNRQWEKACGDKDYCTASGELRHTEARFASWNEGPVDVDSYAANPQGAKNMTGNVWERTRELDGDGWNIIRGGSWYIDSRYFVGYLRADGRLSSDPGYRAYGVGFRCVAPPQDSKK